MAEYSEAPATLQMRFKSSCKFSLWFLDGGGGGSECLLFLVFQDENRFTFLSDHKDSKNEYIWNNSKNHSEDSNNNLKSQTLRQAFCAFVQFNAIISILLYVVQINVSSFSFF